MPLAERRGHRDHYEEQRHPRECRRRSSFLLTAARFCSGSPIGCIQERCGGKLHETPRIGARHRERETPCEGHVRFVRVEDLRLRRIDCGASAFLGLTLNLPADIPNHANYVGHWLGILKEDKRAIFRAAAQAQKAADWILNLHPDYRAQADRPTIESEAPPREPIVV
jgi:hypothetical protein